MANTREEQTVNQETPEQPPVPPPARRQVPPPGRVASFEEAKARVFKKYDKALRELAK